MVRVQCTMYNVKCTMYNVQCRFGGLSGRPIGFYYHQAHTPTQSSFWFWTFGLVFSHLEDDEGDHFGEHNCFVLTPSPVDDFFLEIAENLIFCGGRNSLEIKGWAMMTRRN